MRKTLPLTELNWPPYSYNRNVRLCHADEPSVGCYNTLCQSNSRCARFVHRKDLPFKADYKPFVHSSKCHFFLEE